MIATFSDEDEPRGLTDRRTRIDPQRDRTRLGVLAEVGLLLASSDDYVTILQKLTEMVVPALGDWCSVHIVNPSGQLERIAIRHTDPTRIEMTELLARGSQVLELDSNPRVAARVFATGQSEWVEQVSEELVHDLARDPWQRDAIYILGMRSYIAVPLIVRSRVIGVLTLVRAEAGDEYDRDDLAFGEELARRVAMYVDNAMLLREVHLRENALRDEATRLETLNRIGQELAAIHDLEQVVKKVCDAATALTGAEIGLYFTYADGEAKYATCGATADEAKAIRARDRELTPNSAAMVMQRALRVDDLRRFPTNLGVLSSVPRIRSYLAVPVRGRRGDVIGGISLGHSRAGAFDVRDEQLVVGLASLTATATDSARLFREAHELIAALEQSNRDLDKFASVASHDLRAPLRGIANLSSWLDEDLGERLTDKSREYLGLLRGRVRRLEDLIQGVLDYSRAGRVADEPLDVEVGVLVRDIVELIAPPSAAVIKIDPSLPTLRTTRVPLEQVFMNLIANALKYNPKPAPQVEIGARPIADGWEFFVRDDGPGIAQRYHEQIWGLFQTLHSRDRIESTGIGLAIVRRIVEAHGGRAWIESAEDRGATLKFTWPKDPPRSRSWERRSRPR